MCNDLSIETTRIRANTEDVSIGALLPNEYSWFHSWDGSIDDVQIYDVALGDAEIATLFEIYNATSSDAEIRAQKGGGSQPPQGFDFSLTTPGNLSVTKGSSTSSNINAALISGNTRSVSFSYYGIPKGATASFSSSSCGPTCTTILTIQTSSSTSAGTYSITVSARGGGVRKSTSFQLSVDSTVSLPTPTITPNGGSYTGSVSVTLQTVTSGASIYYTTNGSIPSQSSILYTGAMTLTSSAEVKAVAFKSGSNPSRAGPTPVLWRVPRLRSYRRRRLL